MRWLAVLVLMLAACGGGREAGVSPDLEPARAAALARAEAAAERAREACRARGDEVIRLGPNEWACGPRGRAVQERVATRWAERCAEMGADAFRTGAAGWFCAHATADAGRECRAATDCQGVCLISAPDARIGTCSATSVMPGCVAQLGPDGRGRTVCAP
jgi:hypothetical protein